MLPLVIKQVFPSLAPWGQHQLQRKGCGGAEEEGSPSKEESPHHSGSGSLCTSDHRKDVVLFSRSRHRVGLVKIIQQVEESDCSPLFCKCEGMSQLLGGVEYPI